jgi:very-short-patch-repair endonuclease
VDLAAALRDMGLPDPVRQHPLQLRSGETIHLDLAYLDARLGLEPGATWWHGGDLRTRRDAGRDRACDEIGWRILRFDEVELRDIQRCARQVAAIRRSRLQQFAHQRAL